jgi:chromate reductase
MRILGIVGSLREQSVNRKLLEAARQLAPEEVEIEPFGLDEIPLYNQDLDTDEYRPAEVVRFQEAIRDADALLIATPEYNHSIPGVLQNAIDWASRPAGKSPLAGKPVGIMGASGGAIGTARAQQQLKVVLFATLALVMPHPGVTVGNAREKFGANGDLTDEPTRRFLQAYLHQLEDWVRKVASPAALVG